MKYDNLIEGKNTFLLFFLKSVRVKNTLGVKRPSSAFCGLFLGTSQKESDMKFRSEYNKAPVQIQFDPRYSATTR